MADEGTLVIAGRAGSGNSGHTAIVVPGTPVIVDGKPYPYVCGGGLPMRRSDGNRTAADTWTASERAQVRYFTPETRGWFRRLFGLRCGTGSGLASNRDARRRDGQQLGAIQGEARPLGQPPTPHPAAPGWPAPTPR